MYRKRLRKPLDAYTKNIPPHVQAAAKLDKPAKWVQYVITQAGPEPVGKRRNPIDYQHYIDKQLAPAAGGLLVFLDTSFERITSDQLSMF